MKKLLFTLMATSVVTNISSSVIACNTGGDTIGIILSTTANPYFSKMKSVAEEYLKDKSYSGVFYDSNDDSAKELENIENAITRGHKGIIVNPNNAETNQNADPITSAKIPLITVDREYDGKKGAASFVTDNELESQKLFDNVFKAAGKSDGEKLKVYVLRGVSGADASNKRFKGFVQNNESKIEKIGTADSNFANWERSTALSKVQADINNVKNADVIFAENDEMAMGAYQAMNENNNKDWFTNGFIVGFDGNDDTKESIGKWTETTRENVFSTIEQDPEKMIKSAIDKMIELIDSGNEVAITYEATNPVSGKLITGKE